MSYSHALVFRMLTAWLVLNQARNANIVGILVGTLGVAGYLDAIENLRALIQK